MLPLRDVLAYPDRISVLPNLETDAAAYDTFGRALAESWSLSSLPAKHPPGWMVVLGGVYAVAGHSYVGGKLVSWGALVASVALCAWLAHRIFGPGAAATAAVLCASSPGLRGYVGTLQYEVLAGALFGLLLMLGARAGDASTRRDAVRRATLAGAAGAALLLTRETFVLVVPIVAIWVWHRLRPRIDRGQALVAAAVLLAVAAGPALLWSTAQTIHHERLILISEKGPQEFQLGNNPLANGTYNDPLVGMAEPAGFSYIRAFPGRALALAVRKVFYFFGVLRDGWNVPQPAAVWIWRGTTGAVPLSLITPVVSGGWLLAASLLALGALGREGWRDWWAVPASVGAILAVHVITLASFRYAVPVLPALYALASGPVTTGIRALLPTLRIPIVRVAWLLVAAMLLAAQYRAWPLNVEYDAVDLDGLAARNAHDAVSGSEARLAEARQGARPVVLLPDTYLPEGPLRVTVRMRLASASSSPAAVARITLIELDGHVACARDVASDSLSIGKFEAVDLPCRLSRDTPATLAVFTLGVADLAVDTVRLVWTPLPARAE